MADVKKQLNNLRARILAQKGTVLDNVEGVVELDDVDVRDLLRKALSLPPASERPKTILKDVQQQIRSDSKGKFFADGWSTSEAPRATFLVTGIIMLLVALIAWLLLAPYGFTLGP